MIKKTSLLLVLFTLNFFSCQKNISPRLRIAAAANFQFVIKALTHAFEEETNILCEPIVSSSGKLAAQIKEGAPYDIFLSANMKYPKDLYKNGHSISGPKIFAYGKLVLWTMTKNQNLNMGLLSSAAVNHIALANPKTAPYGVAAMEVLQHRHIFDKVKDKLVYGESIAQVNQFVHSKAVELGFSSMSTVLSPQMKGKGSWFEVNSDSYSPIAQGVVILNNREEQLVKARQFYNFLFSTKAKEILQTFGYKTKDY